MREVEIPTHRGTMVDGTTGAAMTVTIHTEPRVKERGNGAAGHAQHGRQVVARVSLGTSSSTGYIPLDCLLCPKLRLTNCTLVSIWLIYYPKYADEVVSPTETRPYSWR